MPKPVLYTATYNGKEYTLAVKPWCRLVNRSPTFIYKHLALAKAEGLGHNARMQYAIEQQNAYGTKGVTRKAPQMTVEQREQQEQQRNRSVRSALFNMGAALR